MHHSLCLYCALCPGYELSLRQYYRQLCDWGSGYGTLQCVRSRYDCPGSYIGTCEPDALWSGSMVDEGSYYRAFVLDAGIFANSKNYCGTDMYGKCIVGWAFSVRCVLDADFFLQTISVTKAQTLQEAPTCTKSGRILASRDRCQFKYCGRYKALAVR